MTLRSTYEHRRAGAAFLFFILFSQTSWPVFAVQNFKAPHTFSQNYLDITDVFPQGFTYSGYKLYDHKPFLKTGSEQYPIQTANVEDQIENNEIPEFQEDSGPGPAQPEMQSFQPVNNNNMVDLFTGNFSYNIPLLDVGGYPVNLHYQSGITMDQEASWVGLGWNINPGTISRSIRGLPDDFNGTDSIKKTISIKPNKTLGLTLSRNVEIAGVNLPQKNKDTGSLSLTANVSLGVFHNTYKGWGTEVGVNAGINAGLPASGSMSAGLGITNNSQDGLDISPSFDVTLSKLEKYGVGATVVGTSYNARSGIQSLQMTTQVGLTKTFSDNKQKVQGYIGTGISSYISFASQSFTPGISIPFTSSQYAFTLKVGGGQKWIFHPNTYLKGYTSTQYVAAEDTLQVLPSYGYMYYQNAGKDQHVLLDFNRDKDVPYRENVPHIAVPAYTYDCYSISGEGTGGMFRPYRGDVGFIFDHSMATKSSSNRFSLDLGFGKGFHIGVDFNGSYTSTRNSAWLNENTLKDNLPFKSRDTTYEEVYFKNPGEKAKVDQDYYNAIGGDNLVKASFTKFQPSSTALAGYLDRYNKGQITGRNALKADTYRQKRDRRNQVISFLTASEARSVGADTCIKSYPVNVFPNTACNVMPDTISRIDSIRKGNHISEITVLNNDGRRYIYGIPVYNITQQDVTFASGTGNKTTGLVSYNGDDNTTKNLKGQDHYFSREVLPPYVHSYLLTGIVSADYSDVKFDGITEDDIGDAVKFNYSRIYGSTNPYRWRAPYYEYNASYSEGLKTDSRDEKGSYSYGSKEIWYLNSLESKTMMATFVLETHADSLRKDAFGVKGENGGRDAGQKLFRLKEINLYAKADIIKNGLSGARPIKTVHFDYEYALCANAPGSAPGKGKLTLKRVWFSYNKNKKGRLNPFEFSYHNSNPPYNNHSYDRWGNYKDVSLNPGGLSNLDYPYTSQLKGSITADSTAAANASAAWTLTDIRLPSGGKLKVSYESDEYAYVQNKRAMQMFTIAGFGNSEAATPQPYLYSKTGSNSWADNYYVFVKVTEEISATTAAEIKKEILLKYLEGVEKLYVKLFVKMPSDRWGSGSEFIPCYADIKDYGMKGNKADKIIWIKIAPLDGNNPMTVAAMQFLRLNLPSKAYPQSEPGDDLTFLQVLGTIKSAAANISQTKKGFTTYCRVKNWCDTVDVLKSFVRLNNPAFRKFGGGLRVKRIEISDNWNAMTGQAQSTYGQEYDYTTFKELNGVKTRISSGVASYEPSIGKDENPFTVAVDYYKDNIAALAPTNYFYTEEPLTETYYPAAIVGYSKVRVQTIHKTNKSANGAEETEFYTAYDFPVKSEFTTLADGKVTYNPKISVFFKFNAKHFVTLSQGFKVELNDMHGQIKKQASFAQNDLENPYSYTINYYKLEDDTLQNRLSGKVAVIDSANGVIDENAEIGKDIDILVDLREQTTRTLAPSVQANMEIMPMLFVASLIPNASFETNRYRSAAVMKVVNRYGILDSIIHVEKGSKVSTKNMIYDGETGNVLLTRTNNEFDDPVYNFNYPAYWANSGMGHAYKNIGAVFEGMTFKEGRLFYKSRPFNSAKFFESGDELMITTPYEVADNIYPPGSCEPYITSKLLPYPRPAIRVWAMDTAKAGGTGREIYFIDRNGKPVTLVNCTVKIIRSGRRNLTTASAGSVTMLENPVKKVNNIQRIIIDSATKVIDATAAEFREFWRTDSSLYAKDSCYTFITNESITLNATRSVLFRKVIKKSDSRIPYIDDAKYLNQNLTVGLTREHYRGKYSFDVINSSIVDFDFSGLNGKLVTSAKLSLTGKPYDDTVVTLFGKLGALTDKYPYAHHLSGSETYRGNSFNLGRVLTSWKINDHLRRDDISVSPNHVVVVGNESNESCANLTNLECKELIQDIIDAPAKNGIMLTASATALGGTSDDAKRLRSFYSGFNYKLAASNKCNSFKEPGLPTLNVYFTTNKDTCVQLCRPNIDPSSVNPYIWGILGNWRMNKTYTYYGSRKESDAGAGIVTNTRTDEQIKSFIPYWAFSSASLVASTDSSRWVWNSELTQFNRRGMEIENRDPLGRYNSGQYGYNQSLPVAITQNSRLQNAVFDGFEDYDYKNTGCNELCSTARFIDIISAGGSRDSLKRHSGKYSLRLAANQTTITDVPVISASRDTLPSTLSLKPDLVTISEDKIVTGKGNGLLIKYGVYSAFPPFLNACVGHSLNSVEWSPQTEIGNVNRDWGRGKPWQICASDYFNAQWEGFIQPRYNDYYTFTILADDGVTVWINGVKIMESLTPQPATEYRNTAPIYLEQGKLYPIKVLYAENDDKASIKLFWSSSSQGREIIPSSQLYVPSITPADTAGSVISIPHSCVKFSGPKPSNVTLKPFSPVAGTKMILTAWVREDRPCINGVYDAGVDLSFTGSSTTFQFRPKGNVIEGWQRIEDTMTIPPGASALSIKLRALSSSPANFDDIRLHPFNALMKSYVYDPVSLRLLAELDDNNYATFYEYDDDGTLTRLKKETERGIKTIRETRSALLKDQ